MMPEIEVPFNQKLYERFSVMDYRRGYARPDNAIDIHFKSLPSVLRDSDRDYDYVETLFYTANIYGHLPIIYARGLTQVPIIIEMARFDRLELGFAIMGDFDENGDARFEQTYDIELGLGYDDIMYPLDPFTRVNMLSVNVNMNESLDSDDWDYEMQIDGD